MQAYYTIYDHEKWRVGLIQSKNSFSEEGGASDDSPAGLLKSI